MNPWLEVLERLERIEKKLDELARRRTPASGVPAPAPPPKPRQRRDGAWEVWGGEGTGWVPWMGRGAPFSEKTGEKK